MTALSDATLAAATKADAILFGAMGWPEIRCPDGTDIAPQLDLVRKPWEFNVIVTDNIFGDILSDHTAALLGGMGMAPSADVGDDHALDQPCHGTAPDIAGPGKANPTATILSAAVMSNL